jgi:antitoxin component of MazEF toxin-antitoxin module
MSEREQVRNAQEQQQKPDISKLVSIVPPASELKKKEKILSEKRLRVKYDESLKEPIAKIPKPIAGMLGIKDGDSVEVVVAGRKKFMFKAVIIESQEENTIYVYPEELKINGVADNSIATLRKSRQ